MPGNTGYTVSAIDGSIACTPSASFSLSLTERAAVELPKPHSTIAIAQRKAITSAGDRACCEIALSRICMDKQVGRCCVVVSRLPYPRQLNIITLIHENSWDYGGRTPIPFSSCIIVSTERHQGRCLASKCCMGRIF